MLPSHFVWLKPKTASSQKLEVRTAWERGYSYPSHLLKPTSTHTFHNLTPPPLTAFTISHLLQPTSTHTFHNPPQQIPSYTLITSQPGRIEILCRELLLVCLLFVPDITAPDQISQAFLHCVLLAIKGENGLGTVCSFPSHLYNWLHSSFTISHLLQSTSAHTPSFMLTIPQPSRIEDQFLGENVSLLIWTPLVPSHLSSQLGMEPEAPHALLEPHQQQLAPTNRTCLMLTCHQHQLSTSLHLPTRDTSHLVYILCSVILLLLLFLFSLLLLL